MKTMKYEKPEVVPVASAMKLIQHPETKGVVQITDNADPPQYASQAAYAADE